LKYKNAKWLHPPYKNCCRDFKRNKVRTALTSLGIMIGVYRRSSHSPWLGLKTVSDQFEACKSVMILPGDLLVVDRVSAEPVSGASFDERT
jgi:hypothetical protein